MTQKHEDDPAAGVHFLVPVARLPNDGLALRFEPDEAGRAEIARRFDLVSVSRLEADLRAARWQNEGIAVEGMLRADVVQTDVVSLEPVPQSIEEEVRLLFVPEHSRLAIPAPEDEDGELVVDPGIDVPETYRGDRIDLGEPLVQILGLALDPYPRAEGVEFREVVEGEKEPSPFAVLGRLRDKNG